MSKKIKIGLAVLSVLVIVIIGSVIGVIKHREYVNNTRSIDGKVDIGGYGLLVKCYGKGNPTVIFEEGLGCNHDDWIKVQPEISKIARTFSYDRAGNWLSDYSKLKPTYLTQTNELHTLLSNAKVKGPYIIVAHSIAGYNARLFADTYPKDVAGIVFVDSSHENQLDDLKDKSPDEIENMRNSFSKTEISLDTVIQITKQLKEIRKKDGLRNIPITVLCADEMTKPTTDTNKQMLKEHGDRQKDLASLSNKSKFIFVENSGHYIHIDQPKIVIAAIKDMIKEINK